jgi:hypothetical protein
MIRYGDFLLHNAAGALALPGVLVGALLTGIFSLATGWIMRNRLAELAEKTSFATTWLSTSLKRELNFAQDYFVTIHANLSGCRSHDFAAASGKTIDLSRGLEKVGFEFFLKEARKRRLNDLDEWHKYPLSETQSRLRDTVLLSKWSEIETFINRDKKIC